jgi:hypothetical protein
MSEGMGEYTQEKLIKTMKKGIIFTMLIFLTFILYCQNKVKDEIYHIEELEVVNFKLLPVLDTIIQMKESGGYKAVRFFLMEFNEDTLKPDLIFVRGYAKMTYYYPKTLGYFSYKDHYFFITGDTIDSTIFFKTSKKNIFEIGIPLIEKTEDGTPIIRVYGSYAWSIRYKMGRFKILSYYTSNKNDPWFDNVEVEYGNHFDENKNFIPVLKNGSQ